MDDGGFERKRISAAIARAARLPVALLVAPAGSGKTVALRHFLQTVDGNVLSYDARSTQSTLPRFVRGLAGALRPVLPRVLQSLAIAHERATQSPRPADVLAAWLAEHLRDVPRTIVIDNYHRCEQDPSIAAFLAGVIDRTRLRTHWIVAARSTGQLPFAKWFARGEADVPIDETTLALTPDEVQDFVAHAAPAVDHSLVKRLREATEGSIGAFRFALATAAADPASAQWTFDAGENPFERCVDLTLALLEPHQRRFIVENAMCPDVGEACIAAAGTTVAALCATVPHAVERTGNGLRYTAFFADTLHQWLSTRDAGALADAHVHAGHALERSDRIADAVTHYIAGREMSAVARLLETRGLAAVDAGFGDVVAEAVEALDPVARAASPVILAIRATFESRVGRFETAQSWFTSALDRVTEPSVRNHIAYQYGTHLLRFKRPEAIGLLEDLVDRTSAADDLHCYARSALGPAYVFARRNLQASASAAAAMRLIEHSANHHLRARVFHQAGFVALCRDDAAGAKELATKSVEIAHEHGYFDIAAGALTVLYNVASDLEDDPAASLDLLDDVGDCAAKSGSLANHFLALVAQLEIVVERGDRVAIEKLDGTLRAVDSLGSGSAAYEALVASQALRAGWNGDYAGAYRLLLASTEQQWSADRTALRWAEVAVYAAAGGLTIEAAAAIRSALELLDVCEPAHRVVRARLFVALAMILTARSESAREMLGLVDTDPHASSPRLSALRCALAALRDRYCGVRNSSALLDAFEALERQHFGGVARLIMNLPLADNESLRLAKLTS